MKITLSPTSEFFDAPINGVKVPTRVWFGVTDQGTKIEAYVLSIVPDGEEAEVRFAEECRAAGLQASRETFTVDVPKGGGQEITG